MSWSGFIKSISVVLVAIALIAGAGFFGLQYLIAQFTSLPPKPTFPNDKPARTAKSAAVASPTKPKTVPAAPQPSAIASPSPKPTASTSQARITLENGLNVRENPSADAPRIGGVDYDQVVTILEQSPDQEWQKIRVESSGVEGWIKSGHTERATPVPAQPDSSQPAPAQPASPQ